MPTFSSIGDQARAFTMRTASTRTKQLLTTLSREVASGRKDDVAASLGGDTRRLAGVEHRLQLLDSYRRNCAEVAGRLDATQMAMEGLHDIASGLGNTLGAGMLGSAQMMNARLSDARGSFDSAIGLLNTQVAGEYVFAGARPTTRPVAQAREVLNALGAAVSGLTDIDDVIGAVDAFFDAPSGSGGYIDLAYSGAMTGGGPVAVSPDRSVGSDITAASSELRDMLKGMALASLVAEGTVAADPADRIAAVQAATRRIAAADDHLTDLRARQGILQQTTELARARNAAEASTLQIARNDMIRADEYDTAVALSAAQVQLETLYAVTARLSQLSLAKRL